VDDVALVREREGARDVLQNADSLANAERFPAPQSDIDRFTIDIRHHEIRNAVELTRLENRNDVWMLEPGYGEDLTSKSFCRHARRQLGREDLDDDFASQIVVFAHEHLRHSATNELALNGVGPAQSGKEAFGDRGH